MEKQIHSGHRERMRKRFKESGFAGWEGYEVLEYILYYVIPRKNTTGTAKALTDEFGNLENILNAPQEKLMSVQGVGAETAGFIDALGKTVAFCGKQKRSDTCGSFTKLTAKEIIMHLFEGSTHESLYMLCLDKKKHIIRQDLIFNGTPESVNIDIGAMMRIAVKCDAMSIVLAHNHPSGIAEPSQADLKATEAIVKSMELVGVSTEEHFIVADRGCMGIFEKSGHKFI